MSTVTDLTVFRINYLTQQQYDDAVNNNLIDPDELYLTPAQGAGVTDVEVDGVSVVTGGVAQIDLTGKQDTLVSGTNIKTINGNSLLGSGDLTISGGGTQDTWYGTCPTPAATSTKLVTSSSADFTLTTGSIAYIKFTYANSASTVSLNIDSTGSKSLYVTNGSGAMQYMWEAGEVIAVVYDGTRYVMLEGGTASTTYYGVTKLSSSTSSTSTSLAATPSAVKAAYDLADGKQDALVSGTNIKTVNGNSLLGSGDVTISVPTKTSDLTNDSNFVSDASYVHTDNNFTNADVTKLSGIEAGAEVNVQADWNQADNTKDDYIKNKPNIVSNVTGSSPINVIVSAGTAAVSHTNSGVTLGSYGDSSAQTPSWGDTFKVLSATVSATGHVTAMGEHTVTIPNSVATSSVAGLMDSGDKSALSTLTSAFGGGIQLHRGFTTITAGNTTASTTATHNIRWHTAWDDTTNEEVVVDCIVYGSATAFSIKSAYAHDINIQYYYYT